MENKERYFGQRGLYETPILFNNSLEKYQIDGAFWYQNTIRPVKTLSEDFNDTQ